MKKILIIEDNKDMNNLLNLVFEEEQYEVKSCFDGITGLEMIKDFVPDIVILDLELPKLDGREVLKQVQEMAKLPYMIVFSSSRWQEVNASNIMYCPKGEYSPLALVNVVNELK
jgi:DNA-binding response OmpR family regulator